MNAMDDDGVMNDEDFEAALDALKETQQNGDLSELLKVMNENRMISWEEAERILGDTEGPVKSSLPEQTRPAEPDNDTDVEVSIKRLLDDDPNLKQINLNNMKRTPVPSIRRLIEAIAYNTHLEKLSLANMGLYDNNIDVLITVVEMNPYIKSLNLETNYLSGDFFAKLFRAALVNQTLEEVKAVNQGVSFATTAEKEIIEAVMENRGLLKVSVNLRLPEGRHKIENATLRNGEIRRVLRRQAALAAKEEGEKMKQEELRKAAEAKAAEAKKVEEEKKASETAAKKAPPIKPKVPAAPLSAMPNTKMKVETNKPKVSGLDKAKLEELERRASLEAPIVPPVVAAAPVKQKSKDEEEPKPQKKYSVAEKEDELPTSPVAIPEKPKKRWERPVPPVKPEPKKEEVQRVKRIWERPAPPPEPKPEPKLVIRESVQKRRPWERLAVEAEENKEDKVTINVTKPPVAKEQKSKEPEKTKEEPIQHDKVIIAQTVQKRRPWEKPGEEKKDDDKKPIILAAPKRKSIVEKLADQAEKDKEESSKRRPWEKSNGDRQEQKERDMTNEEVPKRRPWEKSVPNDETSETPKEDVPKKKLWERPAVAVEMNDFNNKTVEDEILKSRPWEQSIAVKKELVNETDETSKLRRPWERPAPQTSEFEELARAVPRKGPKFVDNPVEKFKDKAEMCMSTDGLPVKPKKKLVKKKNAVSAQENSDEKKTGEIAGSNGVKLNGMNENEVEKNNNVTEITEEEPKKEEEISKKSPSRILPKPKGDIPVAALEEKISWNRNALRPTGRRRFQ